MKSFFRLFICCFLSFLLSFPVCADSFTDSCSSDESGSQRETYNLSSASSHLAEVDFPAMEDTTALSVSDLTSPGEIIYAVQGVEEVSVSLYRSYASFVVEYPDGKLEYNVLPPEGEEYHILPLWLDETDDSVYCLSNGNYYPLFFDSLQQKILVSDEPVVPKPELVIYGLKIMESSDGISFQEVDYERTYTGRYVNSTSDFLFDETFHASLSPSCRYLKIQIKQFSQIQTRSPSGISGSTDIVTPYSAMIRKVTCTGEDLPLNPDGGADLPSGEEENTFYGEKDKETSSSKSSTSSKTTSSSSSGSKSSSGSTSSSIEHSSSTSTTTSDSNNSSTSTSYTTNYYYFSFSPEDKAAFEQVMQQMGIEAPATSSESDNTDSEIVSTDNSVSAEIVYEEQTIGSSESDEIKTEEQPSAPAQTEQKDDRIIYIVVVGISILIILEIIRILKPSWKASGTKNDVNEEDDDI